MSLIVEDGTGLPNADSYISVADATAYLTNFGSDDWALIDPDTQEILLRKSSRDLDLLVGDSYASCLLSTEQALLWPRQCFTDSYGRSVTGLPKEVGFAVAELAMLNSTADVTGAGDRNGMLKVDRVELEGAVKSWKEYFAPSSMSELAIRKVTLILKPFLDSGSSGLMARIVRG